MLPCYLLTFNSIAEKQLLNPGLEKKLKCQFIQVGMLKLNTSNISNYAILIDDHPFPYSRKGYSFQIKSAMDFNHAMIRLCHGY